MKIVLILFFLSIWPGWVWAQKQLVLLHGQTVICRFNPGDDFVFRYRGERTVRKSYVNNISDTAVVIHRDTVPFRLIERVYFGQTTLLNRLGKVLVIGGVGLFVIDQFNQVVVQDQTPSLDDRVSRASIVATAVGLPLMVIKKKSQRLRYGVRLMMVQKGSPLYKSENRVFPYNDPVP